uniref:Uncharacterized protein n=1 Tax=viral metagenome TaxID=1070528 RepID=A0A6M3LX27_9ZZZZ
MSRTRVKKSPSYAELQRRNRNQASNLGAMAREYIGRAHSMDVQGDALLAEGAQLRERYAWGFWRRLKFAVTGR